MKIRSSLAFVFLIIWSVSRAQTAEMLIYHQIRTGKDGKILPWYNDNPGIAYDRAIELVWKFWDNIRTDLNGLPYYMNHQVWNPRFNDPRGIGGDQ